jgi:hypothetical protein
LSRSLTILAAIDGRSRRKVEAAVASQHHRDWGKEENSIPDYRNIMVELVTSKEQPITTH